MNSEECGVVHDVNWSRVDPDSLAGIACEYAHLLGVPPPADGFFERLAEAAHNESVANVIEGELTPSNFITLLSVAAIHEHVLEEGVMDQCVNVFAERSSVEFIDPATGEDEMTHTAHRVEKTVSTFIEENGKLGALELLSENDLRQLMEIYNPNNLLFLASQMFDSTKQIPRESLDMLYRYRIVAQRLYACYSAVVCRSTEVILKDPKDGARTWAGDIHPYGHRSDGRIFGSEYKDFSETEDLGVTQIIVDGEVIAVGGRGVGHE